MVPQKLTLSNFVIAQSYNIIEQLLYQDF